VTVFSAPNYCGEFDNSGALMSVDDTLMCSFSILKAQDTKTGATSSGLRPKTPPSNQKGGAWSLLIIRLINNEVKTKFKQLLWKRKWLKGGKRYFKNRQKLLKV